jgi:rare lipoprotein A
MRLSATFPRVAALCACAALLAACSSAPKKESPTAPPPSAKYYKNDGPGDSPPSNLDSIPDATPRLEPLNRFANRPYTVLGKDYVPATTLRAYKERGIASWYGRMFHGQKTSIGETYDMYAMSAAHPTLPLPSYARVTNVATGKSVIVRVNDRGPFLQGRIIDLSYAAANRVGIASKGSGEVEVEAIIPGEGGTLVAAAPLPPVMAAATPTLPATSGVTTAPLRTVEPPQGAPASIVEPPRAAPVSLEASGGFAVQLGAFQNFNNAQTFLARVQPQLATAQVEPKVREAGGLYRVYVGPYPDRDEARRVADRLTSAFGFATAIAPH